MEKKINENNSESNMIVNNDEFVTENQTENQNVIIDNIEKMDRMENIDNIKIKTQQDLINEYYQKLQKQKYERFIEIIMNQTTYTRDEAIASLEKHKGDITLVIKEFLGVVDKSKEREKEQNSKSLHQKRYGVIREYMDNASMNFIKKQEQTKKYNEFIEKQKQAPVQTQEEEKAE